MSAEGYSLGDSGLEKLIGRLRTPYVLLIMGHPGSGKTTLAMSICYKNALEGRSCHYFSFYEEKGKLFSYMREIGLDLEHAESRGLLKFTRLPVSTNVENVVDMLNKAISESRSELIVIDSINPILAGLADPEKRAWLLNYFYNLAHIDNKLLVLVAELPYGLRAIGTEEFIADAILVLKSEIDDGFLIRKLEVRKARGHNIQLAEVPFSIIEGRGFKVFVPPVLEEVPSEVGKIEVPCKALRQAWVSLKRGFLLGTYYPVGGGPMDLYVFMLAMAVLNDLRILFISYKHSPEALVDAFLERAGELGIERDIAERLLNERVTFVSINPFSRSLVQLAMDELQLVDSVKPDVVVFHGVELLHESFPKERYIRERYNQLNYLKSRGILIMRVGQYVDERSYKEMALLDDAILKLTYTHTDHHTLKYEAFAWKRGRLASRYTPEAMEECIRECVEILTSTASRRGPSSS